MSAECTSYYSADNVFVNGSSCPKAGGDARAAFCCGFNDIKYCCDDPNSFFPYEYGYMWWLRYVRDLHKPLMVGFAPIFLDSQETTT
uniref:Shisa N-terminal domain-containing protein n=1 Tax=Oncorhynchus tshawytscha TaxID=74940 RepID=A0A8C8HVF7_ONCTS